MVEPSAECRGVDIAVLDVSAEPFGLLILDGDVAQTLLQCGDLAQPLHLAGLTEPLVSAAFDLQQPETWTRGILSIRHLTQASQN